MINNERGNSLITVLLVSLVFTVLGMAIVASSIGGAKRTETRESDISITYDSINLVEKMTTDLAESLKKLDLDNYRSRGSGNKLEVKNSFDIDLRNNLFADLILPNQDNMSLECVNIIDLSTNSPDYIDPTDSCIGSISSYDHFNIEKNKDFTRVFDIILVTKNPVETEGKISRTIKKRLILSPLPSFLKYAVGSYSEKAGLILNGSANFRGNVYANNLTINNEAEYILNGVKNYKDTPMSSINGHLYSSTAKLLDILQENKFYKDKVPALKHDSQFINIDFDKTMNERTNEVLADSGMSTKWNGGGSSFAKSLKNDIADYPLPNEVVNNCIEFTDDEEQLDPLDESCIKSDNESVEIDSPLNINGDFIVTSTNYPISLKKKLVVNGDLYLVGYADISLEGDVFVAGKTYLINYGGKMELNKNLISADTILLESYAKNKNDLNSAGLKLNGDIITGNDLIIKPIKTSVEINNNIFVNHSLTINGDEADGFGEDHDVIFDSVVYAGKEASISKANILGANNNEKQLILLAKEDLLITRINEFKYFDNKNENGVPYLPVDDKKIKPLKGFFYTEKNAELYGVGSLFYIEGGIFAKEQLTINAIRGDVKSIDNIPSFQENTFSRFIVDYDQDVMLKRIEALPIVNQLQIFSDELIVK
ncbi:hypothetical protein BGM26_11315 [Bacillus sp. FJAT-29790]|uniref:hypothetical protein n=1 Tax=Bacillus sp. FJAT-29790 TaxID=1895002 RepID=UPI001C245C40|nr:hypothetical protein [Bacillus sp. FJAT-29790]MBU8879575.1 hypothetical protein [Bacillus sp. FJAT-29790]